MRSLGLGIALAFLVLLTARAPSPGTSAGPPQPPGVDQSVNLRGLEVRLWVTAETPGLFSGKSIPAPPGKRWLSIRAFATNSTDATMSLHVDRNFPLLRDAAGRNLTHGQPQFSSVFPCWNNL